MITILRNICGIAPQVSGHNQVARDNNPADQQRLANVSTVKINDEIGLPTKINDIEYYDCRQPSSTDFNYSSLRTEEDLIADNAIIASLEDFFDCFDPLVNVIKTITDQVSDVIDDEFDDQPIIMANKETILKSIQFFLEKKINNSDSWSNEFRGKIEEFDSTYLSSNEYKEFRINLCKGFCNNFLRQNTVAMNAQQHKAKKIAQQETCLKNEIDDLEKQVRFMRSIAISSGKHANTIKQKNRLAQIKSLTIEVEQLEKKQKLSQQNMKNAAKHSAHLIEQKIQQINTAKKDHEAKAEDISLKNQELTEEIAKKNQEILINRENKLLAVQTLQTEITQMESSCKAKNDSVMELYKKEQNNEAENRKLLAEKQHCSITLAKTKRETKDTLSKLSGDMLESFDQKIKNFNIEQARQIENHSTQISIIDQNGVEQLNQISAHYSDNQSNIMNDYNRKIADNSATSDKNLADLDKIYNEQYRSIDERFYTTIVLDWREAADHWNSQNKNHDESIAKQHDEKTRQYKTAHAALIDEISAIHRKRHTEVTRSHNSFHTTAQGNQETYLAGTQATVEAMKSLTRQSVVELNQHFAEIEQLVQSEIDSSYQTTKFSLPE